MSPPPLTVLGRAPEPGRVKTRLAAGLGPEAACAVHRALALDTLARLRDWSAARGGEASSLVLALTGGEEAVAGFGAEAARRFGLRVEAQSEGDLGERIREALARRAAEGAAGSLVAGTDAPLLDDRLLDGAAAEAAAGACALAPSDDGGFVLLAAPALPPEAFAGVAWGTASVLAEVQAGLKALGRPLRMLPGSADVDEPADLEALAARLAEEPGLAPETARWLASGDWRFRG